MNEEIKCPRCGGMAPNLVNGHTFKCRYCESIFEKAEGQKGGESKTVGVHSQPVVNNVHIVNSTQGSNSGSNLSKGLANGAGFAAGGCIGGTIMAILTPIIGILVFITFLQALVHSCAGAT
ncbi:MAG: hypothetical protein BGN96_11235 [Bacteroidales bacterium 45-6]|uniref:hypothetical protein n=1 Tax=uncultured Dysgonomonas sp. TaxID=206096 RepID=UPI00095AAF1E|nr:hypothetical protein [uncultured Dysgonomonas sp.]OJU49082.1 MAG: hypothetical protein BGN96_11235 [Bacteroidales bacterium 45-6]